MLDSGKAVTETVAVKEKGEGEGKIFTLTTGRMAASRV